MGRKKPDLSQFTDEEIFREAGRRRRALAPKVTNPKVLRPCPKCKKLVGARELRTTHKQQCKGKK